MRRPEVLFFSVQTLITLFLVSGLGMLVQEFDDGLLIEAFVQLHGGGEAHHEGLSVSAPAVEVYSDANGALGTVLNTKFKQSLNGESELLNVANDALRQVVIV